MAKSRVPRASMAVSMLRDPDYIALMRRGGEGREAFAVFVALVLAAKDLGLEDGEFAIPLEVLADLVRIPVEDITAAVQLIGWACDANGNEPWLKWDGRRKRLCIRSFAEWNTSPGWGGTRAGAGRKRKEANQDESRWNQDETPPQVGNGIGSGDRYNMQNVVNTHWAEMPVRHQTGKLEVIDALATAVRERGVDPAFVMRRLVLYCKSPQGRGRYRVKPANFIRRGHYEDDPSAWDERKPKDAGAGTELKSTGALERARQQRMEHEVDRMRNNQ